MKINNRYEYPAILCLLLILLAIFFYDVVFFGKTFKVTTANAQAVPSGVYNQRGNRPTFIPVNGTDGSVLEEPLFEFIKKNLRKGILPLWNPHQACGYPLIGMLEAGIFFPLNAILYLLPQLYAWDVLILARFFLAGLFMYGFMRTLKFKIIPSLVAAICFMLTGPMVLLQYWFANVEIIAPLLLTSLERLIQKPRKGNICFVAVCVALTVFGGHPEHIFFVNVVAFLYFCFRVVSVRSLLLKKSFLCLGTAYILGIGLSAIVLLPFLRNLFFEFWATHPPYVGLTTGEVKNRFLSILIPHFFQRENLTYDFTFAGWWGGYIGVLPLMLAFLSLWSKQRRGLNYFFAVMAFIIIGKAYGFPVINWIGYLPIFNICRFYIHTPHLFALVVAVLAGMGARSVFAHRKIFTKGLIFTLLLTGVIGLHLFFFRNEDHFSISIRASIFTLGVLGLFLLILFLKDKKIVPHRYLSAILVFVLSLELFLYTHHLRPRRFDSFPLVPYMEILKDSQERQRAYGFFWAFYPNTATGYEVDDLGIYFSLLPKRFVNFVNHLLVLDFFVSGLRPPALRVRPIVESKAFLDLLNVSYIITPSALLPSTNTYAETIAKDQPSDLVYSYEINMYRRREAFPRAFIVHKAIFALEPDLQFDALKKMSSKLKEVAVIESQAIPTIEQQLKNAPPTSRSTVKIISYTPNEVTIEADLGHAGFLILGDAFHPDWKVFVDGKDSQVFAADYFLRSVFLTAGPHEVRFVFWPLSFYAGMLVSLLSLLSVITLFCGREKA